MDFVTPTLIVALCSFSLRALTTWFQFRKLDSVKDIQNRYYSFVKKSGIKENYGEEEFETLTKLLARAEAIAPHVKSRLIRQSTITYPILAVLFALYLLLTYAVSTSFAFAASIPIAVMVAIPIAEILINETRKERRFLSYVYAIERALYEKYVLGEIVEFNRTLKDEGGLEHLKTDPKRTIHTISKFYKDRAQRVTPPT